MSGAAPTATALRPADATLPSDHWLRKLPAVCAGVGALGIAASYGLRAAAPEGQFAFSWLVAYTYFLSIALGALFFVLVQFASRSGWSVVVRRIAEHLMATLPLFALLFVPVLLGMHTLYHHWTDTAVVARDPVLTHKSPYLDETFFQIRAALYLLSWAVLAIYYYRKSVRQDGSGDHRTTRVLEMVSAPGLIVFSLTVTFASFDWLMSLDPHWYSTIWGIYFFSGSLVAVFALLLLLCVALDRPGSPTRSLITREHLHDLGKLLFAFTCFWAYIAFSQFMLYWYGNIPEETLFYAKRWYVIPHGPEATRQWATSSWSHLSVLLALGHFVVPFFFLLPRTVKRSRILVVAGASWMLLMHLVDLYWIIMPNLHPHGYALHWLDLTTLLGVGGLFFAAFFWLLRGSALIPVGDPRLPESLRFENF
jgi:hypothetical protein